MPKNNLSLYSAIVANLLIAITKFTAGTFTNSASMISEGIHSVVDTFNSLLLLYGLRRSKKPRDEFHPFGYGKELYFWSFIVAVLIFGLGGGLSIYQGIEHVRHPEELQNPTWNYVVLGLSFVFEGISLGIAIAGFNKIRGDLSWGKAIARSKDPSTFIVLLEDAAAVLGLLIVFILMLINHRFNLPYLDGVASILVGLVLVTVSIVVAKESRSLLMGEGISRESRKRIIEQTGLDKAVVKVTDVYSNYQSPEELLLILTIVFKPELQTVDITTAIERIRERIKTESALVKFVIIQPTD